MPGKTRRREVIELGQSLVPAGPSVKTFLCHILQLNLGGHWGGVPNDAVFGAAEQGKGHGTRIVGQHHPARFDLGHLPSFDLFTQTRG